MEPSTDKPPPLVRWAFAWHLPIPVRWRPWGIARVEARWGPGPSEADRDIEVAAPLTAYGVTGRIFRPTLSQHKDHQLWVLGVRPDGSPRLPEHMIQADPIRVIERLPERLWPWVPVGLTLMVIVVVVGTAALALWVLD